MLGGSRTDTALTALPAAVTLLPIHQLGARICSSLLPSSGAEGMVFEVSFSSYSLGQAELEGKWVSVAWLWPL